MVDNNRTKGPRTLDNHPYNNSPHAILMPWILVQLLRRPSQKQTKKNIGKKATALDVISKATL